MPTVTEPIRLAPYRQARRAIAIGLAVNICLAVVKLVGGIVGRSFALIADAVNSLGDVFVSIVILFALWFAQRPPDPRHPYGHTRAEAIAASNVALLIVISACFLGWEAFRRITVAHDLPPAWTLWIAAGNVIIKESLYWYKIRVGRRTGSRAVIANAWDHRSDALCSFAVLVGLGAVRWGGASLNWADEAAAMVVVLAILWAGGKLFLDSAAELMDMQAAPEILEKVQGAAASVPGVRKVETLRMRKSGLEYFVDIHVEVSPELTVAAGHDIAHRVKDAILARPVVIRDVLVHVEPCSGGK